jgi:stage V sporulation protein D (sporulation-specific penicillin-binding protein)
VIKTDLTLQEATAVRYLLKRRPDEDALRPHPLVGFVLSHTYERSYASGDTSTAILGRTKAGVRNMLRGDGGLEDWGDTILAGSIGWYRQRVRPGERLNPLRPARSAASVQGMDLHLTIDLNIQRICARELEQCMKDHTPLGATAIVLDPKTGDVLGMVSRPSADISAGGLKSENLEVIRNRALMAYEPGSVMKPITISLALEAGVLRPDKDIPCTGSFVPGKRRVRCEAHRTAPSAPGQNTPRIIIAKSCNVATGITALRLGAHRLHAGLERFGLLRPTGVQLPGDVRGFSRTDPVLGSPSRDDVARVGFGQSITVTPLALATAFGVFANDGVLIRPRIIRSYGYPQAAPVKVYPSDPGERVLSCTVAAEMRDYLRSVVLVGTGKNAAIHGYTTAGKTGTASKVKGGAYSGYVASFIGMAPATKPRVIIAVVVDEPHNGYHGSQAAAPTWGRIAADIMDYLKVPPDAPATTAGPKDRKATDSGPVGD